MTLQEKVDFIRSKCVEANPEIKNLQFGCRVDVSIAPYGFANEASMEYEEGADVTGYVTHDDTLECDRDKVGDIYVKDIKDGFLGGDYEGIKCEIIGREIRLADLLLAIGKKEHGGFKINAIGGFSILREEEWVDIALPRYDLSHDSLTWHAENRPEVIEFIYQILSK